MQFRFGSSVWWASSLWLLCCAVLCAQEPPRTPLTPPASGVQEARTPLFFLPDATGKLVPVPGFTLADFERMLMREEQGAPLPAKPSFLIENCDISGQVVEDRAKLTVRAEVVAGGTGWSRVPLRLPEAVLVDAELKGPGERVLERGDDGYLLWLRHATEARYQINLQVLVRVDQVAGETRLRLTPPRSTQATLRLQVPLAKALARIALPAVLESAKPGPNNTTELIATGVENQLDLAWRATDKPLVQPSAVLEAQTSIFCQVTGQSVRSEATLTVRSFQGAFQTFRLRLPDGANLVGNVLLRNAEGDVGGVASSLSPAQPNLLEIKLDKPTLGPLEVRCSTVRLPTEERPEEVVQLAGFELIGAGRQAGQMAVQVSGDWQLIWDQRRGVFQIEPEELVESLRSEPVQFAFEYFSQPTSLRAKVVRRQPRVAVEPHYRYVIYPDRVELEASFKYSVRRAGVRTLEVMLPPGWIVDVKDLVTSPPGLVDPEGILEDQTRPWVIPFHERQQGQFELHWRARLPLPADVKQLSLLLPAPQVHSLGPATVEIQPADNIRLTPVTDQIVGLHRDPSSLMTAFSEGIFQQEPYVFRTSVATARFVAKREILPRELQVQVENRIRVTPTQAVVDQQLSYRVFHEPIKELVLQVPRLLRMAQPVEVWLDEQPFETGLNLAREAAAAEVELVRIPLPRERIGPLVLALRYRIAAGPLEPASSSLRPIPLLMPADAQVVANQLQVTATPGMKVDLRGQEWQPDSQPLSDPALPSGHRWRAVTKHPQPWVDLVVDLRDAQEVGRVRRAWLQTWLTETRRRDRCCWLVSAAAEPLVIRLPAGVERSSIESWVGGAEVAPEIELRDNQTQLTIPLAPAARDTNTLVEVRYRLAQKLTPVDVQTLVAPQLPQHWQQEQTFWEIVLPGDEHLWTAPPEMTPEFCWHWQLWYWSRDSLWNQEQLEAWVGAAAAPAPGPATNRYLFSTWGGPEHLTLRTVQRPILVLIASLVSLVLGLSCLYLRPLRHPVALLVLAAVLLTAGFYAPGAAPLVAQAGLLGVVLTVVSGLLRRQLSTRLRTGVVVRTSGSSLVPRSTPAPTSSRVIPVIDGSTASESLVRELPARDALR